nr:MAG TPA: hypothetical protein [Caudoviricetes sp.]
MNYYYFENSYRPKAKIPFSKDAKVAGLKMIKRHGEIRVYFV